MSCFRSTGCGRWPKPARSAPWRRRITPSWARRDPRGMEANARAVAGRLKSDRVDGGPAHARLTALHARRERARALSRRGRRSDGGDQPHPAAHREGPAAARLVGAVRTGPPARRAEEREIPDSRHHGGASSPRSRVQAQSCSRIFRTTIRPPSICRAGSHRSISRPAQLDLGDRAALEQALRQEVRTIAPFHARFVAANRRTTIGLSGLASKIAPA